MALTNVALKFTHVTQENIDHVINIIKTKHATQVELDLTNINAILLKKLQAECPNIAINEPNYSPLSHANMFGGFGLFTLKDLMPPRDPYDPNIITEEVDMDHYGSTKP